MIVRLPEALCRPCQRRIIGEAWTTDLSSVYAKRRRFADVFTCHKCRDRLRKRYRSGGGLRTLPTLSATARDRVDAIHEAAHAVVGLATGQPVSHVAVVRTAHGVAGRTRFVGEYHVELADYVATCWAGQQATLRWLADQGLDSPATHLDVRFLGWHDVQQALTFIRTWSPNLDATAELLRWRPRADHLLDQHWSALMTIERELMRLGEVTFDANTASPIGSTT